MIIDTFCPVNAYLGVWGGWLWHFAARKYYQRPCSVLQKITGIKKHFVLNKWLIRQWPKILDVSKVLDRHFKYIAISCSWMNFLEIKFWVVYTVTIKRLYRPHLCRCLFMPMAHFSIAFIIHMLAAYMI